ncbi:MULTISPECIES: GNAT family N-acetyltransferase [unclassified Streptomyces]|uniref:GNAT family N-acetyltransferase n=1 Tax=unclassified Streptomyces TaxID=2593676 RepID=UPI002E7FF410|nr:GNAT family N-acetyltransferase [Streptomyces sp. NBC_00523]WUD00692.1 GNAT family N-acetyltransferase [Streptomyces sp. NBC_00523]
MDTSTWRGLPDVDSFLARAGDFLRSRPALHTVTLTVCEGLRAQGSQAYGDGAPVFGVLERNGEVRAAYFRTPPYRLIVTPLTPEDAGSLAGHLHARGGPVPGVNADDATAAAFAEAWRVRTGAAPLLHERLRLYRLGELRWPDPAPEGRGRVAEARDRELVAGWYVEFVRAIDGFGHRHPGAWADTRIAGRRVVLWETPDGVPVSMAALTPQVAGQIRVAPVYTPAELRGRGYGAAATAHASRTALAEGAAEVLLFADLANPTSNGVYQRVGFRPVTDFAVYDLAGAVDG